MLDRRVDDLADYRDAVAQVEPLAAQHVVAETDLSVSVAVNAADEAAVSDLVESEPAALDDLTADLLVGRVDVF